MKFLPEAAASDAPGNLFTDNAVAAGFLAFIEHEVGFF